MHRLYFRPFQDADVPPIRDVDAASCRPAAPEVEGVIRHKPLLSQWLTALGLEISYHRGEGVWLHSANAEGPTRVLDCVGGYGAVLLGHAHPRLQALAVDFFSSGRPLLIQGNRNEAAEALAQELSHRCGGGYRSVFSSTGAEAVECALKHAMLETGQRVFLAVEQAFHGKTLGALQTTFDTQYRRAFELPGLQVEWIAANHLDRLRSAFRRHSGRIAGFLFEPIQGEAGVRPLSPAFVQAAAECCLHQGVPLIADECQSGVGRTGAFLACQHLQVRPDYIVLSKALGGGVAKLAATLIDENRYDPQFDLMHSSTFAADEFSCTVGLEVLRMVDGDFLRQVRTRGAELAGRLQALAGRWPSVLADVRSCGLMTGVEFHSQATSPSFLFRLLDANHRMLYLAVAHLLHCHHLRVMPTLSHPRTLRIQPSVDWSSEHTTRLVNGLDDVCAAVQKGDAPRLAECLLSLPRSNALSAPLRRTPFSAVAFDTARFQNQQRRAEAAVPRVAWLCHMIDSEDLRRQEPGLDRFTAEQREDLLHRLSCFASPVVMSSVEVASVTGQRVRLYPIMLPFTSRMARHWLDQRDWSWPRCLVQGAVDVAHDLGCQLTALGQYTSILTRNGRTIARDTMGISSGNSYTVALTLQSIEQAMQQKRLRRESAALAVVGGAGNIGRVCARSLAPHFAETLLIGGQRPRSKLRAEQLARTLPRATVVDADQCRRANVVVCAVNSAEPILTPDMLASATVVCDVSVPSALNANIVTAAPQTLFVTGGLAKLPFGEDLEIASFPLPPGKTFGCMAEALLLGFSNIRDRTYTGTVTLSKVAKMQELARRHGFGLADVKDFCVFGGVHTGRLNPLTSI